MKKKKQENIYRKLANVVGEDAISRSDYEKMGYSLNRNWYTRTLLSINKEVPLADFVVYPKTTEQVSNILKLANKEKIPITPYSGGSSGMGGNVPFKKGIVVDLKFLDKIIDINEESLLVTAQAGVTCWQLEDELNRRGYTSGHIQASHLSACIGGSIALRAAGRLSTGYGKIEDMVIGLEVVLPNGEILRTRSVPRHATGPDLNQLFIGSEGTLGIITEATLIINNYPEKRVFRAVLFSSLHLGLKAMRRIMQRDLRPIMGRLYDERETETLFKKTWGIDEKGAYLVFGFDGPSDIVDRTLEIALKICREENGKDLGNEKGNFWWDHKFSDYYPKDEKDVERWKALMGGKAAGATIDICAPYHKIEDIHNDLRIVFKEKFGKKYKADFYGHLSHWYTSGTMTYCRWHLREVPQNAELLSIYREVWDALIQVALRHDGVIEHHHGVGRVLGRYIRDQYGSAGYSVLRKIKESIDPNNIMNIGVLGLGELKDGLK